MVDPNQLRRYANTETFAGTMGIVALGVLGIALAFLVNRLGCRSCAIWIGLVGTVVALFGVIRSIRVTNARR